MPRYRRIVVSYYPHHIVQRGHNRKAVFVTNDDRLAYLATLCEFRKELALQVYGYCLMTNHVHLLVNPGRDAAHLSLLMKRLAGRHTRRINRLERRSGTSWEGRFKCSPIESDSYLLACARYIDLNPVRARIVEHPNGETGTDLFSTHSRSTGVDSRVRCLLNGETGTDLFSNRRNGDGSIFHSFPVNRGG